MKLSKRIVHVLVLGFIFIILMDFGITQEIPNTHAGGRAHEIIKLLNGTSSHDLDDYIQTYYAPSFRDGFPIAAHKGIYQATKAMFEGLNVVDVLKSTDNEISVVLESEKGNAWLNLSILVEPDEQHRISSLGLGPGSRPENKKGEKKALPEKKKSEKKLEINKETLFSNFEELHQYLIKKTEDNEFSGAVLVAKDGKSIFQNAYNYASKRFNVPNKIDTKFNLGSINKMFTSVAIAQLIEKGKLSIDDPIGKYLEIFPKEISEKVTIKHLMNMRSGWGDYWGNEYFLSHKDRLITVSDYMEFIKYMPLDFEPGTNFQHSNTGFEVAGAIIEKISDMDYFDYIKKNIYEPADMINTDSYHRDGPVENLAMGYTNMNGNNKKDTEFTWNNTYMMPPRGTPAGGGYSTVEDMLKFDNVLKNHKLLNRKYTNYYLNRFKGFPEDELIIPKRVGRWIGAAVGINAYFGTDLKSSYSIIVLSNYDLPAAMIVGEEIIKMLDIE